MNSSLRLWRIRYFRNHSEGEVGIGADRILSSPADFIYCDIRGSLKTICDLPCELDGVSQSEAFFMAAAAFIFQILSSGSNDLNRSIVIEVSPSTIPGENFGGDKARTEREAAEETARQVAGEIRTGAGESAPSVHDSVAQIGSLPDEVREKPPTVRRAGVRAWLI